jgi:hypothetical protein
MEIKVGTAKEYEIYVEDDSGPVDLTGRTLRFAAKHSFTDPDPPLIDKSTGNGITHLDQVAAETKGRAILKLVAADTSSLDPDRTSVLHYQIRLVIGTDPYVVEAGKLACQPVVDRA